MSNQYRLNQVVDALQLRWDNWSDMCEFAGVGTPEEGKPHGVMSKLNDQEVMTLKIPVSVGPDRYAILSDYVIKLEDGSLHPIPEYIFKAMFSQVEENK